MPAVGASDVELAQAQREWVSRWGFRAYSRMAWPVIETAGLITNWAWDAACDHLEAFYLGVLPNLVMNLPPGTSKSSLACVLFPTWVWTENDNVRFLYASFDDELVRRDAQQAMNLMDSEWYKTRWPARIDRSGSYAEKTKQYYTTGGGMRFSTTVSGKATGWHPDIQIVDDPIKPKEARGGIENQAIRDVNEWWTTTMGSRARDAGTLRRLVLMQRLNAADLSAYCRERGYACLSLPMEYNGKSIFAFSDDANFGWMDDNDAFADAPEGFNQPVTRKDPRTEPGDLLLPERLDRSAVDAIKERVGEIGFQTQYQQDPSPQAGGIFEKDNFKRWTLPPTPRMWVQSWDLKFSSEESGSMVVGQVWCSGTHQETGALGYYLMYETRGWLSFRKTIEAIRETTLLFPQATAKLVENKANGPAVVSMLEQDIDGLILVNPDGGKAARAHAVSPLFDAGNVWVPARKLPTWTTSDPESVVEEFVSFPRGAYDDRVDAGTQALLYLKTKSASKMTSDLEQLLKLTA